MTEWAAPVTRPPTFRLSKLNPMTLPARAMIDPDRVLPSEALRQGVRGQGREERVFGSSQSSGSLDHCLARRRHRSGHPRRERGRSCLVDDPLDRLFRLGTVRHEEELVIEELILVGSSLFHVGSLRSSFPAIR